MVFFLPARRTSAPAAALLPCQVWEAEPLQVRRLYYKMASLGTVQQIVARAVSIAALASRSGLRRFSSIPGLNPLLPAPAAPPPEPSINLFVSAIHMGFRRSPPPYLSLLNKTDHQAFRGLQGANFASAGSGILNITGKTGSTIIMAEQIQYFAKFQSDLTKRVGSKWALSLLSKSIFNISSGGNDVFGFFSQTKSPNTIQAEQFVNGTLSNYRDHLMALYNLGARKFLIIDVPPLGCLPIARAMNPSEACIDHLNGLASNFNEAVKALMSNLSSKLQGMKYSIGSSYVVTMRLITNPEYHGLMLVSYC